MPIEFFDLPQGTPSVTPVATSTGYCSASDVASLNKARTLGVGQNPTVTDVNGYIEMTAGEIDAILVGKGYQVPVNTASYPEAEGILGWANATGAWAMMEQASPNSPNIDRARAAWDAAKKMLADAKFVMNLPMDDTRADPRGPWVTSHPTGRTFDPTATRDIYHNNPADPYFARGMRFKVEPVDHDAKTHFHW